MSSKISNECWSWGGYTTKSGYGRITINRKEVYAHRLLYEIYKGIIPEGLQIDHLCLNPICVNPKHLEAVTLAENVRRSDARKNAAIKRKAMSHCKNGHKFDKLNTYNDPRGKRGCRNCRKQANKRWKNVFLI